MGAEDERPRPGDCGSPGQRAGVLLHRSHQGKPLQEEHRQLRAHHSPGHYLRVNAQVKPQLML